MIICRIQVPRDRDQWRIPVNEVADYWELLLQNEQLLESKGLCNLVI
jgi:hypothetical protein